MFGTFLLFIIYVVTSLGALVSLIAAVFFFLKTKNELHRPREIAEILKEPSIFMSEHEFSEDGNQYRLWFLRLLSTAAGLIVLYILLKLILA